ncbi:unnamed protein product [Closterium sp. NIES-53]
MAAQELNWLTYLLTDLGERPRSSPVLYVDNKVIIVLCQEHRLERKTKHIALRYFLARELQKHGQLRLAYVAPRANSADIFTKALQSVAGSGVSVVPSQKKQREAHESSVKVCKASAGAVPGRADSLAPRAAASIPGSGGTHRTSPLNSSTPTATTAAVTTPTAATTATTTPTAATTATTEAPTPATTPTTTSATSTASTTSTTTTPAATAATLASLALAAAALPTKSRSSPNLLSTKDVSSSSRSVGGSNGGGGTPLKEVCARSAMSSTYSDYTSLSCKEVLLEQVDSEVCGVKCEKMGSAVASVASAKVGDEARLWQRLIAREKGRTDQMAGQGSGQQGRAAASRVARGQGRAVRQPAGRRAGREGRRGGQQGGARARQADAAASRAARGQGRAARLLAVRCAGRAGRHGGQQGSAQAGQGDVAVSRATRQAGEGGALPAGRRATSRAARRAG